MSGRHRKPTNTGRRLARAGALTIMATAPLGLVGSAMAAPLSVPDKHANTDGWADDSDDGYQGSHHSSDSDDFAGTHHASDNYDSDDSDSSDGDHSSDGDDDSDEPATWSYERDTHAAERRAEAHKAQAKRTATAHSRSARSAARSAASSARSAASSARHSAELEGTAARATSWDRLARCESTQNWDANTGNGFKGGLQFTDSTWRAYGGSKYAHSADKASREEQISVAKKVQQAQGWNAWPSCSRKLGYA